MTCRVQARPRPRPRPKTKEQKCPMPMCQIPFSVSFLLFAMFFSEEQKQAGGKQLQCPSCGCPLWASTDGKIEPPVVLIAGHESIMPKPPQDKNPLAVRLQSLLAALARIGRALGLA